MAYNTFEKPSQRSSSPVQSISGKGWRSSSPALSIIGKGRIILNAPITRILRSEGAARMLLRFDEGQRKIGLAPLGRGARRDDRSSYGICYCPNQRQAGVGAQFFLREIGWDGRRCQLDAHWNEKDRLWECKIPDWEADGLELLTPGVAMMRKGERLAMGFSTFARPSWRSSSPALSIICKGRIALNAPLTRILRSEGATRMQLHFDKERRKIGLAPIKKGARRGDSTYAIDYHPNQRQSAISTKRCSGILVGTARGINLTPTGTKKRSFGNAICPIGRQTV